MFGAISEFSALYLDLSFWPPILKRLIPIYCLAGRIYLYYLLYQKFYGHSCNLFSNMNFRISLSTESKNPSFYNIVLKILNISIHFGINESFKLFSLPLWGHNIYPLLCISEEFNISFIEPLQKPYSLLGILFFF